MGLVGRELMTQGTEERIQAHLQHLLGAWPPTDKLDIVASSQRTKPGWDEAIRPVLGIETLNGTVLSVPPRLGQEVRDLAKQCGYDLDVVGGALPGLLRRPTWRFGRGYFLWTNKPKAPSQTTRQSVWLDATDQRLPAWLSRFCGPVLVALDGDKVAAAVGIKRHNHWGHELAVATDATYRRQGLACALVAEAAQQVLEEGAVPIYVHADDNVGSAKTAKAAGFEDKGWRIVGVFPPSHRDSQ